MQLSELGIHAESREEACQQAQEIMLSINGTVRYQWYYILFWSVIAFLVGICAACARNFIFAALFFAVGIGIVLFMMNDKLTFNGLTGEFTKQSLLGKETFTISDITEIRTKLNVYTREDVYNNKLHIPVRRSRHQTYEMFDFTANGKRYSYIMRNYFYIQPEMYGWHYHDLDKLVKYLLLYAEYFMRPPKVPEYADPKFRF